MAEVTTVGKLLIGEAIPADMQDGSRVFNKKGAKAFFEELISKHPDDYVETLYRLNMIAREAGTTYGDSASIALKDLRTPPKLQAYRQQVRTALSAIAQNPKLTPEQKNAEVVKYMTAAIPTIQKNLVDEVTQMGGSFGVQLSQGLRGNPSQLAQILFGDMLVADHRGRAIPVAGLHGYGEGVTPAEYWAGSYAARKGYCLAEGTLVRMADMSVLPIQHITAGMYVLGADIHGNTFPSLVRTVWNNGPKPVWKYTFRVGRSKVTKTICATEDHKILATIKAGAKEAPSKKALGAVRRTVGAWPARGYCPQGHDETLAYTYGQILGDGHFGVMSVTLTSADDKAISSVQADVRGVGLDLVPIVRKRASGMPSYEYRFTDPARSRFGKNRLKQWLYDFGFTRAKAPDKQLPTGVQKLSKDSLLAFVEGYFESDGSVCINGDLSDVPLLRFHSTSLPLLQALQDVLESRLGVYCAGISERTADNIQPSASYGYDIVAKFTSYSLRISHRDSVVALVSGFRGRGTKAALAAQLVSAMKDPVRDERLVFSFMYKEFLGVVHTWDLEVAHGDHLFVLANGMIVSNSDVQFATAKTGFLGKQLTAMAEHLQVTEPDCGVVNQGIRVDGTDPEILGSVLLKETAGLPAGTVIRKEHMKLLQKERPFIRSILTCRAKDGICQKCAGAREQGEFPKIGAFVGIHSSRVTSEPLTQQLGLSAKHMGGIVGVNDGNVSGLDEINQFVQVPEHFKGKSVLSPEDGVIRQITNAPQGGKYVIVNDKQLHVPDGVELIAKAGDRVEAGDMLSAGTPNPRELAELKGLGEGRSYFLTKFSEILRNNGVPAHRRNIEPLARSFFDKVRITNLDGMGDLPFNAIVPYNHLQAAYKPRKDAVNGPVRHNMGKYLEEPVLHYTIGTRVTKGVAKQLEDAGISSIVAHPNPPGFEPEIIRVMDIPGKSPDWKARFGGFGLKKSFVEAARVGAESKTNSTSYIGRVMDPSRL